MILNALLYFANKGSLKTFFFLHARVIFNAKHQRQQKEKKTVLKLCFLRMPELHKLKFCIWIKMLQSVRPLNGFMVSFSSL